MAGGLIQRRIPAAVLATSFAALAVPTTAAHIPLPLPTAAAAVSTPYRVVLPEPTGPYGVGTTEVHLTDPRRADPWQPGKRRELMVRAEVATYLGLPADTVDLAGSTTHARTDAKPCRRHPVLLYSPGSAGSRVIGTNQAEDLAGRGYVVVTIDHTGEAPVEFPGGRVVGARVPWDEPGAVKMATDTRLADGGFVLDALPRLPRRLSRAMNLDRIGMFGYSMGGSTAASAMLVDRRVDAGVNLDGGMYDGDRPSEVTRRGLDRPFLLVGAGSHSRSTDATWSSFWTAQRGWKKESLLPSGGHGSLGDYAFSLPGLAPVSGIDPEVLSEGLGTVDPEVAVAFT